MKCQLLHISGATKGYICHVDGGTFTPNVYPKMADAIKEAEVLSLRTTKTVYILEYAGRVTYKAQALFVEAET